MSNSNQEIIEARLATYIDDELDVSERAEIEQHLQQNPQYRRLLEDLQKGKQMLRALPRESAPTEFADAFFVQLERSGLLDGDGERSPSRMRIDSWPRWVAAAAVVFLTVGLAAIVYFVLPRHDAHTIAYVPKTLPEVVDEPVESRANNSEPNLAINQIPRAPDAATPIPQPVAPSAPVETAKATGTLGKGMAEPTPRELAGQTRAELDRSPAIATALPATRDDLGKLAADVSRDPRVKDLLTDALVVTNRPPTASTDAVVMAVRSNDLAKVQKDLNAYFASRNIDVQPVSRPIEMALNASLAQPEQALRRATATNPFDADKLNAVREKEAVMKKDGNFSDPAAANAPAARGTGQAGVKPSAMQQEPGPRPNIARKVTPPGNSAAPTATNTGAPPMAPAPTAAHYPANPAFGSHPPVPAPGVAAAPAIGANAQTAFQQQERQNAAKAAADGTRANPTNTFLIARRLSRLQARELSDYLTRVGEVRKAEIEHRDAAAGDNKLNEGQSNVATSILPDGVGNGAAGHATDALAKSFATTAPSTTDKATLRKDNIVAGRGGGAAAGSTSRPTLADAQAGARPTTNPLGVDAQRRALANATKPAVGATTELAEADTDRSIDVVIVVQNSAPFEPNLDLPTAPSSAPTQKAPATRPTTQPGSLGR